MEDTERRLILERARAGLSITAGDLAHLCKTAGEIEERLAACAGEQIEQSVSSRLELFKSVSDELQASGLAAGLNTLWTFYLPLARVVTAWARNSRQCIGGLVGLPGAGKTTLTHIVHSAVSFWLQETVASVSLDDFYYTPDERQMRGFIWRAMPGTHDLGLLSRFLAAAKTGEHLAVPRYDTRTETRLPDSRVQRPRLILFEGWFVGARVPGYEVLADALDFLIYVDMDLETAHQSRVLRERTIRLQSNNVLGMSAEETERFWEEAILPTAKKWVLQLKSKADLVLRIDEHYSIREVTCQRVLEIL